MQPKRNAAILKSDTPSAIGVLTIRWIALCAASVLLVLLARVVAAQTTINVNAGQTLTDADLLAGSFQGTNFALGPNTTFEVNEGGRIGPVGVALDFNESIVNINNGGRIHTLVTCSHVTLNVRSGGEISSRVGANSGVTLNVFDGGTIGQGVTANSGTTVNFFGGTTDSSLLFPFRANAGSTVNIQGGSIGSLQSNGSTIEMSGGIVGSFDARSNNTIDISGGSILGFRVGVSSVVDISGASFNGFRAESGSTSNITGGVFGSSFFSDSDSEVSIFGNEFVLNGVPFSGSTVSLVDTDILSGTLVDGSPFIFSPQSAFAGDNLAGVSFISSPVPTLDLTPVVIDGTSGPAPTGLRAGQTLTLQDGGELGNNFAVVDADLIVTGGAIGNGLEVVNGNVEVTGGTIRGYFEIFNGSTVDMFGGIVGPLRVLPGAEVNLFGTEFAIDSVSLDMLTPGEAFTVPVGNFARLSGRLADGSEFSYLISTTVTSADAVFSPGSTLTVTLIPEPTAYSIAVVATLILSGALGRHRMSRPTGTSKAPG
jgi:hypothetical protein